MRFRMLASPSLALIRAELLRNLRGTRPFLFMTLLVLAGWFTVWANYPWGDTSLTTLGQSAEAIFLIYSIIVMVSAALFLPAIAATAIVSEREQETFDQLAMTLIPPKGMIFAKFSNAIGFYLLIVGGSLPVLGSVFFMVGLDIRLVLLSTVVLFMGCLSVTAIGIAASAYSRRTLPALALAYVATLFLMGGHDFLFIIAKELLGWRLLPISVSANTFMTIAVATSPPVTIVGLYNNWGTSNVFYWACCYHAVLVCASFVWTLIFLKRGPRAAPEERCGTRWLPRFGGRHTPIPDHANAMRVKETRWGLLRRRGRIAMWIGSFALFFVIQAVIVGSWDLYDFHSQLDLVTHYMKESIAVSFIMFMLVVLPTAPLFFTNLYTKERELNNLDMLRVSLLSSRDVYFGKLYAGLRGLAPLILGFIATGVLFFVYPILEYGHAWVAMLGMVTVSVSLFFVVAVAVYAGVASTRTATGVVAAYAAGLIALLGLPLLIMLIGEVSRIGPREAELAAAAVSPVISWFVHIAERQDEQFSLWAFVMLSYTALSLFLLLRGLRRFSRIDT